MPIFRSKPICLAAAFAIVILFLAGGAAFAEKRVALVVGNNAYVNLGPDKQLRNAVSDARLVRDTLKGLGFAVIYGENLDRRTIIERLFDLAAQLGKDDIGMFFFAGHGVAFSGANYLLPSDIPEPRGSGRAEEGRLAEQAISEATVIEHITGAGARVALVVLDACRENPLQGADRRSVGWTRGLAQSAPARGVFSIYSAGFGQAALDRLGVADRNPNSVFVRVFTEKVRTPGLDLKEVATQTRSGVVELAHSIGHDQFPAYYDQLIGDGVYLAGPPGRPPARQTDEAARAWTTTKDTASKAVLEDFIRQFGLTPYGSMARARLQELERGRIAGVAPPAAPAAPPESGPQPAVGEFPDAGRGVRPLDPKQERALKPGDAFEDCDACPTMIVAPAGAFTMGSPESEPQRSGNEGPQRTVVVARPFAIGKYEVTVDQFAAFVNETGYDANGSCYTYEQGKVESRPSRSWRNPGYPQTGAHPVACVSWRDAQAFVTWLAKKTGKAYRLPTEAEWEYAARARTSPGPAPRYGFGDDANALCRFGNAADQAGQKLIAGEKTAFAACNDRYAYAAPAGSFAPNAFGLHDMHGNVWEWTEDCYHANYGGAPTDGAAWINGDCSRRVLRGGSWVDFPHHLRAAYRYMHAADERSGIIGFRVARTIAP